MTSFVSSLLGEHIVNANFNKPLDSEKEDVVDHVKEESTQFGTVVPESAGVKENSDLDDKYSTGVN